MELEYCLPPGFVSGMSTHSTEIAILGATLRGADSRHGARIPDTPLNIRLLLMLNSASIEFDYHNALTYLNFCCFQAKHADDVFDVVGHFYRKYGIGKPWRPTHDKWMHLIPVAGTMPDLKYSILSQQLAVSFFWAAYWQQFSSAVLN